MNSKGWSAYSSQNSAGVDVQTAPTYMNVALIDEARSTDEILYIFWHPIVTTAQTGASPILSYSLEWDQASDNWLEVSNADSLSFTLSSGVQQGVTQQFRLRAINQYGAGPYSLISSTVPAAVPVQMSPVRTEVDNIYVKISFDAPDNQGAEITAYRVLILSNDMLTWRESAFCVSPDLSCYVPMSELRQEFGLPYGRLVVAKVQAQNRRGWSVLSESNTSGALIETEPLKMQLPVDGEFTSQTQLHIMWT
jgi:hypothetical protein